MAARRLTAHAFEQARATENTTFLFNPPTGGRDPVRPFGTSAGAEAMCADPRIDGQQHLWFAVLCLFSFVGGAAAEPQKHAVLEKHQDEVTALAFSPDGKQLASACSSFRGEEAITVWDVETGKVAKTLPGHRRATVNALAFSPAKPGLLVSGGTDDTVRLWDTSTGTNSATLKGLRGHVSSLAFTPDGNTLVTASADEIALWDMEKLKCYATIKTHYIYSLSVSPDGKTIASAGRGKAVKLWNLSTGDNIATLEQRYQDPKCAVFSPDGKVLASTGDDFTFIWDLETKKITRTLKTKETGSRCYAAAFSPDGSNLVTANSDRDALVLWDPKTGNVMASVSGHKGRATCVAFSPNGSLLASGGKDHRVILWAMKPAAQEAGSATEAQRDQKKMESRLRAGQFIDDDFMKVFGQAKLDRWKADMDKGCPYGQFMSGYCLLRGIGGVKHERRAATLLKQAAERNNSLAKICLASLPDTGPEDAFKWYKSAADDGNALALEYLAACFREARGVEKDFKEAFSLSQRAAVAGVPAAMNSLGSAYLYGQGVEKNETEAFKWFEKGASQAHPWAMNNLGICYIRGAGVKSNPEKAASWFRKSAEAGNGAGHYNLGLCYEHGWGVKPDSSEASKLYKEAAAGGIEPATVRRAALARMKAGDRPDSSVSPPTSGGASLPRDQAAYLRTVYEAEEAAWAAQNNFLAARAGTWAAMGITPPRLPPRPSPPR